MKKAKTDKRSQKPAAKSHKTTATKSTGKKTRPTEARMNNELGISNPRQNEDSSLRENTNSESNQNGRKGNM
jgi:hypothetical protein